MLDRRGIEAKLQAILDAEISEEHSIREAAMDGMGGKPPSPPLNRGGPSGTSPPVADDPLKARVDFLQTAFLWLAGALVTATVAVIGIAITLANATNNRLDKSVEVASSLNREVGVVGTKVDDSNRRLDRIERKLDEIGAKLGK